MHSTESVHARPTSGAGKLHSGKARWALSGCCRREPATVRFEATLRDASQIETESPPAAAPLDAVGFVIGRGSLELGFQRKFPVSLESSEASRSRELGNASADAFDGVRARATDVRGRQVAFGNQIETESPPAAAPLDAVGFVIGRGSLELGFQRKFPVSLESSEAFLGIAPGGLVGRLSRALQSVFGKPTARRVVSTRTSRRVRYRGAGLTSPRREGR